MSCEQLIIAICVILLTKNPLYLTDYKYKLAAKLL